MDTKETCTRAKWHDRVREILYNMRDPENIDEPPLETGQVKMAEALRFMEDCLMSAGATPVVASQQAEMLIQADRFGCPCHGIHKLEYYVNDILHGSCTPNKKPTVVKETVSTALVDGNNVLGATASNFAMDLAIAKAKETGIGWVSVKGSNHNGRCGYWAKKAADKGMIGMAFSNSSPYMVPTRGKEAALGTNPIAVVAPGNEGELFYLDMATTAVAASKLEMQKRKGMPLPPGWALGPDGRGTMDAEIALNTKCLMPLGGTEATSGYKGYGLGAMVELFCGMLSGSNYAHHVPQRTEEGGGPVADLGQCFVAIDPEAFAPGFGARLADCMQHWRHLSPAVPKYPVLSPGDLEKDFAVQVDNRGTFVYIKHQIESCAALAERLKVTPMVVVWDQAPVVTDAVIEDATDSRTDIAHPDDAKEEKAPVRKI